MVDQHFGFAGSDGREEIRPVMERLFEVLDLVIQPEVKYWQPDMVSSANGRMDGGT